MKRPQTIEAYARRIERVARFIADRIDDDVGLDRLSEEACLSPYHFHRVYLSVMGETTTETVRRLRLHRSAVDLIQTSKLIADVGKRAGYGSVAAFTRAFAAAYGAPPAAYRRVGQIGSPNKPTQPQEIIMYQATVDQVSALRLIGFPHRGDYNEIGKAFDPLFAWAGGQGLLGANTRSIGVYYDDPDTTPLRDLRSFAGVVVSDDVKPAEGMTLLELPAMQVACVLHKGPYAELMAAYRYLYQTWLPTSGREPGAFPCFEEYLNNPRALPPTEWLTRVHMPLAA